jgi:hypothetical protein
VTTISYSLPSTGYCAPSAAEAAKLARIVDAACPWLALIATTDLPEFRRALTATGLMFRLPEPDTKHSVAFFVDAAADMLAERWGAQSVSLNAFLGAVLARSWRMATLCGGGLIQGASNCSSSDSISFTVSSVRTRGAVY